MEEFVTLKVSTYDRLQNELHEAKAEVKELRTAINSIRVFDLKDSYSNIKTLVFTDFALEQFRKLVDSYPDLKFKELDKEVMWSIAEPKEETEGGSNA